MKKKYFVFLILLFVSKINAQVFTFPQTSIEGTIYNCSLSRYSLYVSNTTNQFDDSTPSGSGFSSCLHFLDDVEDRRVKIKLIFREVFSQTKVNQMLAVNSKGQMMLYFKIDKNGNVLELAFSFDKDLPITPSDIVQLEAKLKLIKFIETRSVYRCGDVTIPINYIPIADKVRFSSLYP